MHSVDLLDGDKEAYCVTPASLQVSSADGVFRNMVCRRLERGRVRVSNRTRRKKVRSNRDGPQSHTGNHGVSLPRGYAGHVLRRPRIRHTVTAVRSMCPAVDLSASLAPSRWRRCRLGVTYEKVHLFQAQFCQRCDRLRACLAMPVDADARRRWRDHSGCAAAARSDCRGVRAPAFAAESPACNIASRCTWATSGFSSGSSGAAIFIESPLSFFCHTGSLRDLRVSKASYAAVNIKHAAVVRGEG